MVNSRAKQIFAKIVKLTTTSKTTDITLANDSELFVTLPVGTYNIEINIFLQSTANPDFKYTVNHAGTATGQFTVGTITSIAPTATSALGTSTNCTTSTAILHLKIIVNAVVTASGILSFQWAQQTSHADTTSVRVGSSMVIIKS